MFLHSYRFSLDRVFVKRKHICNLINKNKKRTFNDLTFATDVINCQILTPHLDVCLKNIIIYTKQLHPTKQLNFNFPFDIFFALDTATDY